VRARRGPLARSRSCRTLLARFSSRPGERAASRAAGRPRPTIARQQWSFAPASCSTCRAPGRLSKGAGVIVRPRQRHALDIPTFAPDFRTNFHDARQRGRRRTRTLRRRCCMDRPDDDGSASYLATATARHPVRRSSRRPRTARRRRHRAEGEDPYRQGPDPQLAATHHIGPAGIRYARRQRRAIINLSLLGRRARPTINERSPPRRRPTCSSSSRPQRGRDIDVAPALPSSIAAPNLFESSPHERGTRRPGGQIADFSNFGPAHVQVRAHVDSLLSTVEHGGRLHRLVGTSIAAPRVSRRWPRSFANETPGSARRSCARLLLQNAAPRPLRVAAATTSPRALGPRRVDLGRLRRDTGSRGCGVRARNRECRRTPSRPR